MLNEFRLLTTVILLLSLIPIGASARHVSIEEMEEAWNSYAIKLKGHRQNSSTSLPLDLESLHIVNLEASKSWEKVLKCFGNRDDLAMQAYQAKNFSACENADELTKEIAKIQQLTKQLMQTSKIESYQSPSDFPKISSQMIHPLFTQSLLAEIAKSTLVAIQNIPDKPKQIGLCLGFLSIGYCEYRAEKPRSNPTSIEEQNMLFSLRFLPLEDCSFGFNTEKSYSVLIGIMNAFGIDIYGSNYVVVRKGNGVFYSPKEFAEDSIFISQGSFAAYTYSLQNRLQKSCSSLKAKEPQEISNSLLQFSEYAEIYK